MEFTLLAAAALGVGGFWSMLRWEAKRGNAAGCALDLFDSGLTAAASGLLIGRLVAMIQVGINPLTDPAQIILVRSGVSTIAASIGTIVMFAFLARKTPFEAADAIGPAALTGLAGWHGGSIITGTWLGTVSDLPWAQAASGSTTTRHPVEIYAALLYIAAAIILAAWKERGRPPLGVPTGLSIAAAGTVRLVTEPVRISLTGGPIWFYGISVITGLAIVGWRYYGKRRP